MAKHIDILSAEDKCDIQQGNVSVNKAVNVRLNDSKAKSNENKVAINNEVEYNSFAEDEDNDWNSYSLILNMNGKYEKSDSQSDSKTAEENSCDN